MIRAFGTVTKGLLKGLKDLQVGERVETIQTTALLRTAKEFWRFEECCCHSNSSERPSAYACVKNSKGKYINCNSNYVSYTLRVFHIIFSWWSFTVVWATASLQKSPRTFLSILADLNNAVSWMVTTRSLFPNPSVLYQSFSDCTRARITVGTTVTSLFHSFFNYLAKVQVQVFPSFQFYSEVSQHCKIQHSVSSLCFLS